jgi:hypothetical protein
MNNLRSGRDEFSAAFSVCVIGRTSLYLGSVIG